MLEPHTLSYAIIDSMKERDVKILAIVGMSGSGKSVAVDYLAAQGLPKVYLGGMIYKEMEKRGIAYSPDNEREFREQIRRDEGKDWVVRQAIAEVNDLIAAGQKRIILDGIYSWTEYKVVRHEFPGEITFVSVVAPRALRYERVAKRPNRPFNAQQIRERDYSEIENMEKGGPIAMADYFILNDSSTEHLEDQLKTILKEIDF